MIRFGLTRANLALNARASRARPVYQYQAGRVYFATLSRKVDITMAQFVEFVGNHWILSSLWLALLTAFILYRSKTGAQSVSPQQAVTLINRKDGVVLDIRDKKEFEAGYIVDAINIPSGKLATRLPELEKFKHRPVIVVCKMGQHSGDACKTLTSAGFGQVVRMQGGMAEWRGQGLPVVTG